MEFVKENCNSLNVKKINFLLFLLLGNLLLQAQKSTIPPDYKLVYAQDLDAPQAANDFEMTDENAWRINAVDGNNTIELHGKSNYRARVRSPFNIALLKEPIVGDFVMEVRLAQSGREYGHRDLCLFFGFQNPTNYYYVHMATVADDHANNIFLVNDEPRVKIASKTTTGTDWGATNSWHTARIHRMVEEGTIRIYFDDMKTPIMEAADTHFGAGRIGFGSFDDTGQFDDIKIWAPHLVKQKEGLFERANQEKGK